MFYGLTTPNAAPIEIHVNCFNSMGRFHPSSTISTYSVAYHDFETLKLYPAAPPIGVSGWRGERAGGFSQPVDS